MATISSSIEIQALGPFGDAQKGTAKLEELGYEDRWKRSLKTFGIFWGIAIGCVFIPILHFVLVPTFLLLGPILAIRAYRQSSFIFDVEATCPQCKAALAIGKTPAKWPIRDFCRQCRNEIKLERQPLNN